MSSTLRHSYTCKLHGAPSCSLKSKLMYDLRIYVVSDRSLDIYINFTHKFQSEANSNELMIYSYKATVLREAIIYVVYFTVAAKICT